MVTVNGYRVISADITAEKRKKSGWKQLSRVRNKKESLAIIDATRRPQADPLCGRQSAALAFLSQDPVVRLTCRGLDRKGRSGVEREIRQRSVGSFMFSR